MIEKQQEKYNWEFLFLGANIDAITEAGKLGIRSDRAVRYENDREGTILNFTTVGCAIETMRKGKAIKADWAREISDYQKK